MKIEHKILADRIHLLTFETQEDITSTLLRFQEHYESPHFSGKIFSLDEYKKWYIENSPNGKKTGNFTYYSDWNGFNIPSYVLKPFYEGKFDPLSMKEKQLLDIFKNDQGIFYIIGIHGENGEAQNILEHEIAHGLFYTNEEYRKEVLETLATFDVEPIKKELRAKAGYHEHVLDDEVHAYAMDSSRNLKAFVSEELSDKLRKIYSRYSSNK